MLTNEEVEALAEPTELECTEPDFCFQFEPEEDIRQNPRVLMSSPETSGRIWKSCMRICKR